MKLAFYGIDATLAQIRAGTLGEKEGMFIVDGFHQTIRDYVHDKADDALVTAAQGQASDIPAIGRSLQGPLSVARQDGLRGHEELAQKAQAEVVRILNTFSERFSETCLQQDVRPEVVVGLQRQNDLMGTGISLEHCLNRKLSVDMDAERVHYHFEGCTVTGLGMWKVTLSGAVTGEGDADLEPQGDGVLWDGSWEVAEGRALGYPFSCSGFLKVVTEKVEVEAPPAAAAPDDRGPNAVANDCRPVPAPPAPVPERRFEVMRKFRATIVATRGGQYRNDEATWIEGQVKSLPEACGRP